MCKSPPLTLASEGRPEKNRILRHLGEGSIRWMMMTMKMMISWIMSRMPIRMAGR